MDQAKLKLIQSLIQAQSAEIENIYAKIKERRANLHDVVYLESLAYQIHNLYSAFENLFEQIAELFENQIQDMSHYHRALLWRMKIPIEGIRPALISEESFRLLDSLQVFRHFFRHAYQAELDPQRVERVLQDALRLRDLYPHDFAQFFASL